MVSTQSIMGCILPCSILRFGGCTSAKRVQSDETSERQLMKSRSEKWMENNDFEAECDAGIIQDMATAGEQNALHVACMSYPTIEVLRRIVKDHPGVAHERNSYGQTPLHIAAARGASPRAINYILQINEKAALVQDYRGRTPLHHACANRRLCDTGINPCSGSRDLRKGPHFQVIDRLCRAAPESVNIEDGYGCTALEYAIRLEAQLKIVRTLHRASENAWTGGSLSVNDSLRESVTRIPHLGRSRFSQLQRENYINSETPRSTDTYSRTDPFSHLRFSVADHHRLSCASNFSAMSSMTGMSVFVGDWEEDIVARRSELISFKKDNVS